MNKFFMSFVMLLTFNVYASEINFEFCWGGVKTKIHSVGNSLKKESAYGGEKYEATKIRDLALNISQPSTELFSLITNVTPNTIRATVLGELGGFSVFKLILGETQTGDQFLYEYLDGKLEILGSSSNCSLKENIVKIANIEDYDKYVFNSKKPVLVGYVCSEMMTPEAMLTFLEKVNGQLKTSDTVFFTDLCAGDNYDLQEKFSIVSYPTYAIFKEGKIIYKNDVETELKDVFKILKQ